MYNMPMPPALTGTAEQQLMQMHRYLFRLNDELQRAMTAQEVTFQGLDARQQKSVTVAELEKDLAEQYSNAKSLIIKTADIVRSEMTKIEAALRSEYIAKSEWGEYREDITQEIEATATGIVQSFGYEAQINAVGTAFEAYRVESQGYIRSGIIGFDDDNLPIYGIAIGQNLSNTTADVGGEIYDVIDMSKDLATYTANRITFWQNGVAAMYISNSEMVINKIKLMGPLQFREEWMITHSDGFGIKWIGGDV